MTSDPFVVWFTNGLDQCPCKDPFMGLTLPIGFDSGPVELSQKNIVFKVL